MGLRMTGDKLEGGGDLIGLPPADDRFQLICLHSLRKHLWKYKKGVTYVHLLRSI